MNNNLELANFITSFGSMNDYKSTILQTKRALDLNDDSKLKKASDIDILKDALDGIKAAKKFGFSSEGIIEINKAFVHSKTEDPKFPGHLRTSKYYNPDDKIVIITDPNGTTENAYYAPDNVFIEDLNEIVNNFNESSQSNKEAWRVFARISKLQPFQDGNKRTALIAANAAENTWHDKNYLVLPFNNIDHAYFMLSLMKFYKANSKEEEESALAKMVDAVPSEKEIRLHLSEINQNKEDKSPNDLKTRRVKFF